MHRQLAYNTHLLSCHEKMIGFFLAQDTKKE